MIVPKVAALRLAAGAVKFTRSKRLNASTRNWIFVRPNASGEKGALALYGKAGQRPELDRRRT